MRDVKRQCWSAEERTRINFNGIRILEQDRLIREIRKYLAHRSRIRDRFNSKRGMSA